MKRNIWSKLIICFFCLILFSCKAKKSVLNASSTIKSPEQTNAQYVDSIQLHQNDFKTFITKANTKLNLDGKEFDVTLNIRIKKGEGIWVSITAIAGLEVARALITPDSLQVMDRINTEYLQKPFSYLKTFTNPQVDYATLESLLVGNIVPLALNSNNQFLMNNEGLNLAGSNGALNFALLLNKSFKAFKTDLSDNQAQQSLEVKVTDFEKIEEQLFPKSISLASQAGKQQISVEMVYNKIQLDVPVEFPFNVPKRFSVID
ncbi:MAG: DUF4292 domain-containing protein [Sphingobacteriales bacterium]|nr:DUF4292 domain-containing protein [Sphingobacteriales bacterium]